MTSITGETTRTQLLSRITMLGLLLLESAFILMAIEKVLSMGMAMR
jgi:hypothetical protein